MRLRAPCALAVTLVTVTASAAGPTFTDDFESGTLSRWQQSLTVPQNTFAVGPAAAHRGDAGVRLSDADASTGSGPQNYLSRDLAAVTLEYHVRFWFRMPPAASVQPFTLLQLQTPSQSVIAAVGVSSDATRVTLQGTNSAGDFTVTTGSRSLGDGQWHLVEAAIGGLATNNGRRRLWVDGVLETELTNLDYSAAAFVPDQLKIGSPSAGNGSYTGTLDFDDVRAGPARWANVFTFDLPAPVAQGQCLRATLRATTLQTPATVMNLTEQTRVEVGSGDGLVEFFSDAACATPVTSVDVVQGSTSAQVWFKSRGEGAQTLVATHPDYLRRETPLQTDAPTAVASASATMLPAGGGAVTLSSEGSTPAAGHQLTAARWRIVAGPTGVELPASPPIALSLSVPGRYRFELKVEDSAGGVSKPAFVDVEVPGEVFRPEGGLPGCSHAAGPLGLLACVALVSRATRARRAARPANRPGLRTRSSCRPSRDPS
ncbi:MAG: hypothetical protein JNK82_13355 [Myxococcaceae bacterium]|nr:hypothetical protein [Myxococcaceae bacterium]